MNYYFEIWADAINQAESSKSNMTHKDKMSTLLIMFSVAQGLNLVSIFFLIGSFYDFNPFITFTIFPSNYLNTALSGIVTLFLPFAIINYFLIFYKKRYTNIILKRKLDTGGKAFMFYFLGSGLIFFLIIILGKFFFS